MTNKEYLDEYLSYMKYKNKAPNTINAYKTDIVVFLRFIKTKSILELTRKDVERFFQFCMNERDNCPARIHRYKVSLKSFIKYLVREEYLNRNYVEDAETPQIEHKRKNGLSFEEVERLREMLKDDIRQRCLFEVMLATGARVNEIYQIKISNINFETMMIENIIAKRRKPVTLLLSPNAIEWIKKYLEVRPNKGIDNLFVSRENNPLSIKRMQSILNKWGDDLGLTWSLTPHAIRRTCATLLFLKGMSAEFVQQTLNHENINTTLSHYINIVKDKVMEEKVKFQL